MKKFACEMCGSSDLLKDGDFFVCQSCGMKYTPDAAKKLIIEGTITVDRSQEFENLITLARRARDSQNLNVAYENYSKAAIIDANNWEAYYFSALFQKEPNSYSEIIQCAEGIKGSLHTTFELIRSNIDSNERSEIYHTVAKFLQEVANKYISRATSFANTMTGDINNTSQIGNIDLGLNPLKKAKDSCYEMLTTCAEELKLVNENEMADKILGHVNKNKGSDGLNSAIALFSIIIIVIVILIFFINSSS